MPRARALVCELEFRSTTHPRLGSHVVCTSARSLNLISRPGDYSINDHGSRLNCQGIPVHYQLDPCAFFSPIARLISGYFTFLDVFLVHPRLVMDTNDDGRTQLWLFDEEADADKGMSLSYPLDAVFPLNTCQFIGLRLPCPRKPEVVLTHLYGPDFIRPSKKCNQNDLNAPNCTFPDAFCLAQDLSVHGMKTYMDLLKIDRPGSSWSPLYKTTVDILVRDQIRQFAHRSAVADRDTISGAKTMSWEFQLKGLPTSTRVGITKVPSTSS
ncbi:uncharacterized protein DEA37_0005547 [Paragonimus westermani]|uniref:Uncharacterized protein n=1 Tax=Paragonimus westermani TaxID=34504 RepID=A0A5J4NG33_9TREM|nr:uncharacterized protein DEA37_0005547 [Paragonimus westermani]